MFPKIFVNLPVSDLARSQAFFAALGWSADPRFTDDEAACLVISDTIFAVLVVEPFFATFTEKAVVDAGASTEAILGIGVESRDQVDAIADAAFAAGASASKGTNDQGFMYGRSFADPDGHLWEVFWMDPAAVRG